MTQMRLDRFLAEEGVGTRSEVKKLVRSGRVRVNGTEVRQPEYKIDPDLCRGCSACARQCPADCIHGEIKSPFTIDASACIKCGTCISVCKFGAVYKD